MSESRYLLKEGHNPIVIPTWLIGMPIEWVDSYFEVACYNAISTKWGYA